MLYNQIMTKFGRRFAIVCVNWNGSKFLNEFFGSLIIQTYSDFKIFFVDNGSQDNSIKIVKSFNKLLNIEIISLDQNFGFAQSNNLGIESALNDSYKYVITLNNDLLLEEHCLEQCNRYIETHQEYDSFQILMLNYYNHNLIDAAGLWIGNNLSVKQIGFKKVLSNFNLDDVSINGICAGAAIYSAESLIKTKNDFGYFDERFFAYYEDVDLSTRMLRENFKSSLINKAIVYHIHSGTGQQNAPLKTFYITRNWLLYRYLNSPNKGLKFHCESIIFVLKQLLKSLIRLQFKNFVAICRGTGAYLNMMKVDL
jgi:GT2 family glycosyltransferase